jgi:hypothetical protein
MVLKALLGMEEIVYIKTLLLAILLEASQPINRKERI